MVPIAQLVLAQMDPAVMIDIVDTFHHIPPPTGVKRETATAVLQHELFS